MKHYRDKIAKLKKGFKKKYDNWYEKTIDGNIGDKDNWVVNLSNKNLSKVERKVLLLGLNFLVSQGGILKIDILANIEKGIRNLPDHTAIIIKGKVVAILKKKHRSIQNLSFE